ncbi:MAG: hypothetical protein JXA66_03285 [Oligoflexia bacterium]|nr:hypothetical protein [Oligoflexia bacterium]
MMLFRNLLLFTLLSFAFASVVLVLSSDFVGLFYKLFFTVSFFCLFLLVYINKRGSL